MDWKNWAGGQRTWRCAATRDTWLITWLVTRVTWLIICLAVLCQHWWAVRAKSKLEMQSFFSHFPTNTKAIKMLITHNGMIPLSTAPLISADFCIQTQFTCQARDQNFQLQSWWKSCAWKLEIKERANANVSWNLDLVVKYKTYRAWQDQREMMVLIWIMNFQEDQNKISKLIKILNWSSSTWVRQQGSPHNIHRVPSQEPPIPPATLQNCSY